MKELHLRVKYLCLKIIHIRWDRVKKRKEATTQTIIGGVFNTFPDFFV